MRASSKFTKFTKVMRTSCSFRKLQNPRGFSKRDDEVVQPVAEDPADDDRTPVDARAEPISTLCEPSESEKMKHELTHIPFNAHHASKAKRNKNLTNEWSVSSKTTNFPLFSVTTLF